MRSIVLASCLAAGCSSSHSTPAPDSESLPLCTSSPRRLVSSAELAPPGSAPVGVSNPFLAVDGTGVYYNLRYSGTNGAPDPTGHIAFAPFGGAPQILGDGAHPARFVVTSTNVIFVDDDGLHSVPRDLGAASTLAQAPTGADWLASDGQQLYFQGQTTIDHVAITGGTPQPIATLGSFSAGLVGSDLIVADFGGGTVTRVSTSTGAMTPLATGQLGPLYPIACGAMGVCWINAGDLANGVGSIVKDAAQIQPVTLVTDAALFHPHAFVGDGSHFFVLSDAGNATLSRVDAMTGAIEVLLDQPHGLHGDGDLVLDDQCIYYSSFDGIFSLAKDAPAVQ